MCFYQIKAYRMSTLQNKHFHSNPIRPKKSLRFLVIGQLYFFGHLFFLPTGKYVMHVYARTKFPIHKVWWLYERLHKSGKRSYPYPAILAAIGHHFIAKKKRKLKMPTRGSEAMRAETRNQRLFVGLMYCLILCGHV